MNGVSRRAARRARRRAAGSRRPRRGSRAPRSAAPAPRSRCAASRPEQVRADEHQRARVAEGARGGLRRGRRRCDRGAGCRGRARPARRAGRRAGRPRRRYAATSTALGMSVIGRAAPLRRTSSGEHTTTSRAAPSRHASSCGGALELGRRPVGREPVVGDVVERRPARRSRERRRAGVVDPQQRMRACRARPRPRMTARASRSSARGSTRRGSHFTAGRSSSRPGATAGHLGDARGRRRGRRRSTQVVQRIRGRLDEEHPQAGVASQQPGDEVLVAAPHVVPALERHHDEVGHSTLR